jgi:uncharacterized protein (DUF1697 family)
LTATTRLVALLRGVNIGAHQVAMADLRAEFESLGHTRVDTYIQSGNVVFTAGPQLDPAGIAAALAARFGFRIPVLLRSAAELRRVVNANPFPSVAGTRLHVAFMADPVAAGADGSLDREQFLPEEFAVDGSEIFMHLPGGMARTKLPAYLERRLRTSFTVRNWNTVERLAAMAAGEA